MSNLKRSTPIFTRNRNGPGYKLGIKGHHATMQLVSPFGVVTKEVEAHNVILDQGLDRMGTIGQLLWVSDAILKPAGENGLMGYCAVGEGVETATTSDTGLVGEAARTDSRVGGKQFSIPTDRGAWKEEAVFEFTPQQVEGKNLTACIFSDSSSAGQNANTKVLFPEVITVPTGFFLRISYAMELTWDIDPVAHTLTIPGLGSITGQVQLFRRGRGSGGQTLYISHFWNSYLANYSDPGPGSFREPGRPRLLTGSLDSYTYGGQEAVHPNYTGDAGQRTGGTYTVGTYEKSWDLVFGLIAGNGDFNGVGINAYANSGGVVAAFSTTSLSELTKDNEHILTLEDFKISWGRA